MSKVIRVGIAGFGISAKVFHIPFIITNPAYKLVTVLERSRNEAQQAHPEVKIVRTIEELVADAETDLIIITTPNETHFPYAAAALRAGKHVVVEKPFTNTHEEAAELIKIAKESNRILSVYHNRRYVSDFLTICDIVDSKALGDVHEYVAHYDRYRSEARPAAWREAPIKGSGILYDLGAHLVDQSLYLFGLPKTITADVRMQRPHAKVDDFFALWLDYGFTRVALHSGMLVREMGPRYMVHGTAGSYIKYGEDPQEAALRAGQLPNTPLWGQENEADEGLLHTEINGVIEKKKIPSHAGNFGAYYTNLYESIANGAPLKEKPEHGYNTVRMIELAFQSSNEKRTVECTKLIEVAYRN